MKENSNNGESGVISEYQQHLLKSIERKARKGGAGGEQGSNSRNTPSGALVGDMDQLKKYQTKTGSLAESSHNFQDARGGSRTMSHSDALREMKNSGMNPYSSPKKKVNPLHERY